jgi:mono/diheme cytochrome c family protein
MAAHCKLPPVLLALTTNQKLGLAGTAAVFIVFALLVALLVPRRYPDFPGRRGLVPFILVTLILTIAMLGAVEVFAKEEHQATETHEPEPEPQPEPGPPAPEPPAPEPPPTTTAPSGSAAAGRTLFQVNGCGGCHAFEPAGTSGATGPDLGDSLAGKDAAYISRAITDPDAEVAEGYGPGVMPKTYEEQFSAEQLDDLVAFLQSG